MAPRGRARKTKVGLTRKDAAIDAMSVMGFPRKLINQTITELLKVYGGNEGWRFIEMDSYKALIEAILEKNDPEADGSQDDDAGGNSQRFSEAGSSSVPPPSANEEVVTPLPPVDDGLDSESQTETVVNPPFTIPESAEEWEEGASAGPLDQVSNLNNSMAPCFDEDPAPILSLAAVETEVAGPPDPVSNLNNSVVPWVDEHPAPILSVTECKVFTPPAEEDQVPGPPDPVCNPHNSMAPCFDKHPAPVLSSMSRKHRPCHGFLPRRKNGDYDEPTNLVVLEPSPLPEEVLKLLGRDIPRSRKRMWDVRPKG